MNDVEKFLADFGVKNTLSIVKKGNRYFHVTKDVQELSKTIKGELYSQGIMLGETKPAGFMPSFYLLDLCKNSERYVEISDETEWLFICKRDVFEQNIKKQNETYTTFIVKNRRGEVLGLGKWDGRGKKRWVAPIIDRGDFLRREERKKKKM